MGRGLDGYFDIRALALCGFEGPGRGWSLPVSGGYGEGETPLPIPNRAVKPLSADGTWPARAWESRSPPVYLHSANDRNDTLTDARSGGADPGARGGPRRGDGRQTRGGHSVGGGGQPARGGERPARGAGQPARGAGHLARGDRAGSRRHPVVAYFRANPQVFALLVICLVLGVGTFIAVLVSLVTAGSDQTTGEPSGAIFGAHAALAAARALVA